MLHDLFVICLNGVSLNFFSDQLTQIQWTFYLEMFTYAVHHLSLRILRLF